MEFGRNKINTSFSYKANSVKGNNQIKKSIFFRLVISISFNITLLIGQIILYYFKDILNLFDKVQVKVFY